MKSKSDDNRFVKIVCHYHDLSEVHMRLISATAVQLSLDLSGIDSMETELQRIEQLRERVENSGGRLVLVNLSSVQVALLHLSGCLSHYVGHNYTMATTEWKNAAWHEGRPAAHPGPAANCAL